MYRALSDAELELLLSGDVPFGDLTTAALAIGKAPGWLEFLARTAMVVCGTEEAVRLFELAGAGATLDLESGATVEAGGRLLRAEGPAEALHRAWKTAQLLVETCSGIASAAARLVAAAGTTPVACTRKSIPGAKALSIKAARAGGASMHRHGLSDSLLVFPEHRIFLVEPPALTIARLRRAEPERKIAVEVTSVVEACDWASAGADLLQLEKFSPAQVEECVAAVGALGLESRPLLLAAGGVTERNAAEYVRHGADVLVSSAPFSAPPADVKVVFAGSPGAHPSGQ